MSTPETPGAPQEPERAVDRTPAEGGPPVADQQDVASPAHDGAAAEPDPTSGADPTSPDPTGAGPADADSTDADSTDADSTDAGPTSPDAAAGGTSLYVRRGRTPTLGFWVALAFAVPSAAALLSAPFFDFADLSGVFNFVLLAAVFVGLPLAAIAAFVDARMHRRTPRRRR